MCGGVHYGEIEGLVSVERWSCNRGASCVVEYTMGRLRDWSLEKAYVGFVSDPPHPIIQPSIFKSPQIFVRKFLE